MAEKLSVSLDPKHIKIVERHGRKIGVSAFSTALQALIHEFDQQQRAAEAAASPAQETPAAEHA